MGRIRLLGCNEFAAPIVPFPHEFRIASEKPRVRPVLQAGDLSKAHLHLETSARRYPRKFRLRSGP